MNTRTPEEIRQAFEDEVKTVDSNVNIVFSAKLVTPDKHQAFAILPDGSTIPINLRACPFCNGQVNLRLRKGIYWEMIHADNCDCPIEITIPFDHHDAGEPSPQNAASRFNYRAGEYNGE
jgi:hypothetical protein